MTPTTVGIIGIIALFVLIFSRMPVAFIMTIIGFVGFGYVITFNASMNLVVKDFYTVFGSQSLTVVPLFVLMGQVAFHSGISKRLFDAAYVFLGNQPGGLAMATIGACAGFSAICGSTNATAATMGAVTLPEMKRFDYKPELATGVVAAGGSLGILIPPSVIFIVYGVMTQQSIGKLFVAGIIPGVLLTGLFIVTIAIWTRLRPDLGPAGPATSFREKCAALPGIVETIILFAMVMGGLFAGIFTPTEAGAVGALGTIVLSLIRRRLTWKSFVESLMETTRISCMILLIVAGATVFGHFLAVTRIPFDIATWISSVNLPSWAIIMLILVVFFVGGCFIDSLALIMLTVPIFYPVIILFQYDPVWFGVVIVLMTQIGVITPPVGINVYVVSGVARDVPLQTIFRGVLPFLLALIITVLLLIPFPGIALWLPGLM
ncbi:MAG: TRAP transporter large permease [Syntrophales bacterium]|jgi:tripartite ATP-independent transporter DctM subunit|nr:TRAP transporter large permease [Syntrophales bacterium]MCK9527676.1 TRAP transporter large permease [Syntrophales bacterium]MDX9921669.1 TRAP transporter large permease [Syntrophales bacterium]